MNWTLLEGLLAATVTAGTTLLLASLGEILTERSGVLNLGVEGMMLVGAITGYIVTQLTGGMIFLAVLLAMIAGGLMALLHAFITIRQKASQVVSGLALTLFGTGVSTYLGSTYVGSVRVATIEKLPIPLLKDIPFIGPILFNQNIITYISIILCVVIWVFIYRTKYGLRLRCVGENPAAADAAGINVFATRYIYTFIGGMLAGLAGAYLSLSQNTTWVENATGGAGWIAVALVIFAAWDPIKTLWGCYLFGLTSVIGLRLQAFGIHVNTYFFRALPYIATVIVLIFVTLKLRKSSAAPASLGLPYDREER